MTPTDMWRSPRISYGWNNEWMFTNSFPRIVQMTMWMIGVTYDCLNTVYSTSTILTWQDVYDRTIDINLWETEWSTHSQFSNKLSNGDKSRYWWNQCFTCLIVRPTNDRTLPDSFVALHQNKLWFLISGREGCGCFGQSCPRNEQFSHS